LNMADLCAGGKPIGAGPCKHCGATSDQSCPVAAIKAGQAFKAMLAALKAVMKAKIIYTGSIEEAFEDNAPADLVAQVRDAIAQAEAVEQ